MDRAETVYESMVLRGYQGSFGYMGEQSKWRYQDVLYLFVWVLLIILFRSTPVILVIGNLFGGAA
jgi:energy-coupling factor transporter transmembrane protein EcfT